MKLYRGKIAFDNLRAPAIEEVAAGGKSWRERNPTYMSEYCKAWRIKHPNYKRPNPKKPVKRIWPPPNLDREKERQRNRKYYETKCAQGYKRQWFTGNKVQWVTGWVKKQKPKRT